MKEITDALCHWLANLVVICGFALCGLVSVTFISTAVFIIAGTTWVIGGLQP